MQYKLKPEVKKQWVEALRSGEYKQGQAVLCKDDAFCCLGVLCDLAVKAGVIEPPNVQGGGYTIYYEGSAHFPGESVEDWAYQDSYAVAEFSEMWYVDYAGGEAGLSHLNDNVGLSFTELADLIEEHL